MCDAALRGIVRFDDPVRIPYAHGKVGVAAMALLWAQPLNGLLRPHPGVTRRRRAWEYLHALLGRCAITLGARYAALAGCYPRADAERRAPGIVNIVTGTWILGRELRLIPFNTWATWAAFPLGLLWLAGAALQKTMDQSERMRQARRGGEAMQPLTVPKRVTGTQPEREP